MWFRNWTAEYYSKKNLPTYLLRKASVRSQTILWPFNRCKSQPIQNVHVHNDQTQQIQRPDQMNCITGRGSMLHASITYCIKSILILIFLTCDAFNYFSIKCALKCLRQTLSVFYLITSLQGRHSAPQSLQLPDLTKHQPKSTSLWTHFTLQHL